MSSGAARGIRRGALLLIGVVGALLERERGGVGQTVTTSLLNSVAIFSNARRLSGKNIGPA